MTPKEKASELIKKFDYPNIPTGLMSTEIKQCALICVDEIIKEMEYTENKWGLVMSFDYWKQVKKEIEKL